MISQFNIQERWPELFDPLTAAQARSVVNTLASQWHEGWAPNRDDVADLAAYVAGALTEVEYDRRTISHTSCPQPAAQEPK